jgi:hypothetical protein
MTFRSLMLNWDVRSRLAEIVGKTFGGKRDLYRALGYKRVLDIQDYRSRYERNAVANRIVKALPMATWKGGADVIEDDNPSTETTFEAAWSDLAERLKIWQVLKRADILAGIGRYSIILIGAPGELETPLLSVNPDEIAYLQPYAEDDAKIQEFETDITNPRFGHPRFYNVSRTNMASSTVLNAAQVGRRVHYTRVIHVADGLLDDSIFGEPRLQAIWNLLDDLEKVTGGGAEAFWRRADRGMQFDLDPTLTLDQPAKDAMKEQIKEYEHGLRRYLTTRGVDVKELGSDVADFSKPVESIISQIAAGTGIPQRVLMGSEQAKLAATMDRSNWDDRVQDRREDFADPYIVRPFIDRMISLGALPEPGPTGYDVKWTQLRVLDDSQRADVAVKWATLNNYTSETVVTPNDIRERVLGLPPLEYVIGPEPGGGLNPVGPKVPTPGGNSDPNGVPPDPTTHDPKVSAARKGEAEGDHVLRSADRFSRSRPTYRQLLLRRRAAKRQPDAAAVGGVVTE